MTMILGELMLNVGLIRFRQLHVTISQGHADFTHGIGAPRDSFDLKIHQNSIDASDAVNALENGINRSIASGSINMQLVICSHQRTCGGRRHVVARRHLNTLQCPNFLRLINLIIEHASQVVVSDRLLDIRQLLESRKDSSHLVTWNVVVTQLAQAVRESIHTRVLTQHQGAGPKPYCVWAHNLVRLTVLQHAILMDTCFMCKSVGPNNRLVWLNRHACVGSDQLTCPKNLLSVQTVVKVQLLLVHVKDHGDFFKGCIPCAFTNTVDGDLHLPCTCLDACKRVRGGQAQIVMAMSRPCHLVAPLCVRHQILHFFHVLVWRVIPNSVWDIEGRSTSLNHGAQHLAQEIRITPSRVFRRELDVVN
mmetsp:Transcript_47849/g.80367  ORF Transcript_47849/g.80367 Transcript_47849/m.80367 type:complete len:363 (-) Transcript_47849:533-1621(-)